MRSGIVSDKRAVTASLLVTKECFVIFFTKASEHKGTLSRQENELKKQKTQLTFTCSKSIIETLEKGVKYVKIRQ